MKYTIKDLKIGKEFTTKQVTNTNIWRIDKLYNQRVYYTNITKNMSFTMNLSLAINSYFNKGNWIFLKNTYFKSTYGRLKTLFI